MSKYVNQIASIFREHNIEPNKKFEAAAGRDYGYVSAWRLPDGKYLIEVGNNATTEHFVADDADDLAYWLDDDLHGVDAVVHTANIHGKVKEASPEAEGPFYIVRTRRFYTGVEISSPVTREGSWEPQEFASYEEASEWIRSEEERVYMLASNEVEPPRYTIVT